MYFFYSAFITQLQIQIEHIDAEALKQQNREIRREIFGLQSQVLQLETEVS